MRRWRIKLLQELAIYKKRKSKDNHDGWSQKINESGSGLQYFQITFRKNNTLQFTF